MRKSINNNLCNGKSWLLATIEKILATPSQKIEMHSFIFENSKDAAKWNAKIIEENNFDYSKAVEKQPNSMITPGSELRTVEVLETIFKFRKDWPELKEIITKGCCYPIKEMPDEATRLADLEAMIERGNHRSASSKEAIERISQCTKKRSTGLTKSQSQSPSSRK